MSKFPLKLFVPLSARWPNTHSVYNMYTRPHHHDTAKWPAEKMLASDAPFISWTGLHFYWKQKSFLKAEQSSDSVKLTNCSRKLFLSTHTRRISVETGRSRLKTCDSTQRLWLCAANFSAIYQRTFGASGCRKASERRCIRYHQIRIYLDCTVGSGIRTNHNTRVSVPELWGGARQMQQSRVWFP